MTDNNELLELAKKCGARIESWVTIPPKPGLYYMTPEQLSAFAEAIRERLVSEGWRQCAKGQGETQHCAQAEELRARNAAALVLAQKLADGYFSPSAYRDDEKTRGKCPHGQWYYEACESCTDEAAEQIVAVLSTQQDADAFIAEVQSKALQIFANRLTSTTSKFPSNREECAAAAISVALELRASATQPEGKETGK